MAPKLWPKRLIYSKESIATEVHISLLRSYLHTGRPEDTEKYSWVIETKSVFPHLQIKKITPSLNHPLSTKKTLAGHPNYGVFATKKIDVGTEIGEYVGEMSLMSSEKFFTKPMHSEYLWVVTVNDLLLEIDAQKVANELALINDYRGLSCMPNVKMMPIIHRGVFYFGYIAISDIEKREELLVDYGETFQNILEKQ